MNKGKRQEYSNIMSLNKLARQKSFFRRDGTMQDELYVRKLNIMCDSPADMPTRFSDEEIMRAELRLGIPQTRAGRREVINLLNRFDYGHGDVDDVIDAYENDPGY